MKEMSGMVEGEYMTIVNFINALFGIAVLLVISVVTEFKLPPCCDMIIGYKFNDRRARPFFGSRLAIRFDPVTLVS